MFYIDLVYIGGFNFFRKWIWLFDVRYLIGCLVLEYMDIMNFEVFSD